MRAYSHSVRMKDILKIHRTAYSKRFIDSPKSIEMQLNNILKNVPSEH